MKISKVIKILEELKTEHGNIEVYHYNDWTDFLVNYIRFYPASDSYPIGAGAYVAKGEEFWEPNRIIIGDE